MYIYVVYIGREIIGGLRPGENLSILRRFLLTLGCLRNYSECPFLSFKKNRKIDRTENFKYGYKWSFYNVHLHYQEHPLVHCQAENSLIFTIVANKFNMHNISKILEIYQYMTGTAFHFSILMKKKLISVRFWSIFKIKKGNLKE